MDPHCFRWFFGHTVFLKLVYGWFSNNGSDSRNILKNIPNLVTLGMYLCLFKMHLFKYS